LKLGRKRNKGRRKKNCNLIRKGDGEGFPTPRQKKEKSKKRGNLDSHKSGKVRVKFEGTSKGMAKKIVKSDKTEALSGKVGLRKKKNVRRSQKKGAPHTGGVIIKGRLRKTA